MFLVHFNFTPKNLSFFTGKLINRFRSINHLMNNLINLVNVLNAEVHFRKTRGNQCLLLDALHFDILCKI